MLLQNKKKTFCYNKAMSENELTETIPLSENTKKTSPCPPKTDSLKEWEAYLKEIGLTVDRGKDPQEITLSTLARFGEKNRPPDYNHENDLYIGNTPELYDEDAVQCDARIGADIARQKPEEFEKFIKKSLAGQKRKTKRK
jgi:hypothetical protein